MIVVSDFDGTLTIDDVTTLFWDAHLTYDWRRELLPETYAGRVTPLEMIARGYRDIALPPEIPIVAFTGTFEGGSWQVSLPDGMRLAPGEDFKRQVVADLRRQHPGHPTVYLGDGRLDLPAAESCDEVFAVRGTKLAELCTRARLFERLDEVVAALEVR
jgi:2-hydroxy-3-keto-5-methylthiopentenyl-1-phosphate phosphatase